MLLQKLNPNIVIPTHRKTIKEKKLRIKEKKLRNNRIKNHQSTQLTGVTAMTGDELRRQRRLRTAHYWRGSLLRRLLGSRGYMLGSK